MYSKVYNVDTPSETTKKMVKFFARIFSFTYNLFSVFMARKIAPCIMNNARVVMAIIMLKGLKKESQFPINSCCSFKGIPNATFPSIKPNDKAITIQEKEYTTSHVKRQV